jgi:hypothetical protein
LAAAGAREPLLVTGSLFVVGEAREALALAAPDIIWQSLNEGQDKAETAQNPAP